MLIEHLRIANNLKLVAAAIILIALLWEVAGDLQIVIVCAAFGLLVTILSMHHSRRMFAGRKATIPTPAKSLGSIAMILLAPLILVGVFVMAPSPQAPNLLPIIPLVAATGVFLWEACRLAARR